MKFSMNGSVVAAVMAMGLTMASGVFAAGAAGALLTDAKRIFAPLPSASVPSSPDAANLGRRLFFETRVSADGKVSCSHCHQPALYGTDRLPKSFGVFGKVNLRNAPTVFNADLQFKQALTR
jgi:cytochrome c peroxidase